MNLHSSLDALSTRINLALKNYDAGRPSTRAILSDRILTTLTILGEIDLEDREIGTLRRRIRRWQNRITVLANYPRSYRWRKAAESLDQRLARRHVHGPRR